MSGTKAIYLIGNCQWAKVKTPDDKFNKYNLDLYLTEGSWGTFEKSGIQVQRRESENGTYVKLSRPVSKVMRNEVVEMGPPKVLIREVDETGEGHYVPFDGKIGNGSLVNCKVLVYDTRNGIGHTLDTVAVETLVPFDDQVKSDFEFPF